MTDYNVIPTDALTYVVSCNMAVSIFTVLKLFKFDKKICHQVDTIVTALKIKFPDLSTILK